MKKSNYLVVANWKMGPKTIKDAREIFSAIKLCATKLKHIETVICPPTLFISDLSERITGSKKLSLGAQDVFWQSEGSFTGQISPNMLKNAGVSTVITGHSELREMGETDETVNRKVIATIKVGLSVILCVGEKERDDHGTFLSFIEKQLKQGLAKVKRSEIGKLTIAYEPIWAIGKTEQNALKPRDLHEMVIFIRKIISGIYGQDVAHTVPILYGGSVSEHNAASLIFGGETDGLLVGHLSLIPESFRQILKTIDALA